MDKQHHHTVEDSGVGQNTKFWLHANNPHNVGELSTADGRATGIGSCGDSLSVCLCIQNDKIRDISHMPNGCVYTVACGSAMSEIVKGRSIESALALEPEDIDDALGGLPEDHLHCARLAVNTLGEAIADYYRWCCKRQYPQRGSQ